MTKGNGVCLFDSCGYKIYKDVMSHVQRTHPNEPFPGLAFTGAVDAGQIVSCKCSAQSEDVEDISLSEDIQKSPGALRKEKSFKLPKTYGQLDVEDLCDINQLEKDVIAFSIKNELSHVQYERLIHIIERAQTTGDSISCQIWDTVKNKAKKVIDKQNLDFKEHIIDINAVKDFPADKKLLFKSSIEQQPILYYRDIFEVSESIFSDPRFQSHVVLTPSKLYRGDECVYTEIYTGDWWNNVQLRGRYYEASHHQPYRRR